MYLKDEMLDRIALQGGNVAQFASFAPNGTPRFARIRRIAESWRFADVEKAADAILRTGAPYVNIRSFLSDKPDGNPFVMGRQGFETPQKIAAKAHELLTQGFYLIVNEEIDVNDGGFSGVLLGNTAEFATRDVPRCVEKPGCAALPRQAMLDLARIMYGCRVNIPYDRSYRVEFSVHPSRVGYHRQHQIIWQFEKTEHGGDIPEPKPHWPNRISVDMGDKAYGLLMAHLYKLRVPRTLVIARAIPPFAFGEETGSPETCWRRTCPRIQQPGLFTTKHGQIDPFALMHAEDPDGTKIAAMIFQDDVEAVYSGAAATDAVGHVIIEGKAGNGDDFMIGVRGPDANLPEYVRDAVRGVWERACSLFGPVCLEWCYDKSGTLWIVQFHVGQSASIGDIIYPGEPNRFEIFEVRRGLPELRLLIARAEQEGFGVVLKGGVGITSHFGDVLRRNRIPSRLERSAI